MPPETSLTDGLCAPALSRLGPRALERLDRAALPVEDERDDARLGALAAPRVVVAPLQERAERRRERERAPLAVLRHAGLQAHETSVPVDLTPHEREGL